MSGTFWISCPHCTHRFLFARDERPEHVLWIACCSRCGKTFPVSMEQRGQTADTPEAGNVRALPEPAKPPALPPYRPSGSNDPVKPPVAGSSFAVNPADVTPPAAKPELHAVPKPVTTPPPIEVFVLTDQQRAVSFRLLVLALGADWEWLS